MASPIDLEGVEGARSRRKRSLDRERTAQLASAFAFAAAAIAIALLVPTDRTLAWWEAAVLVAAYAACSRVEFEVGSGASIPTQLVFVPMLFAAPLPLVPFLVAAGAVAGEVPQYVRGRIPIRRVIVAVPNAWYSVGPVLVLAAVGERPPDLGDAPLYVAALGAQFAFDLGNSMALERFGVGGTWSELRGPLGWTALVDTLLSPLGLLAAFVVADETWAIALVLPAAGLLRVFASERRARIDNALARGRAESRLSVAEERYQSLVESLPLVTYRRDLTERAAFTYLSPQLDALVGAAPSAWLADPGAYYAAIHPSDRERVAGALGNWLARGGRFELEYRVNRADGQVVWLLDEAITSTAPDGTPFGLGSLRDVTESRYLQARLEEAQRMEAVGRLAGGVAHDFNNILTAIIGLSDFVLADLEADDPSQGDLKAIRLAGERAAALTQQLLAFGRRQHLEPEILDLNEVVTSLHPILRGLAGESVDCEVVLQPGLHTVRFDRSKLEQVVVNLVANARDAMPGGGRVVIETRFAAPRLEFVFADDPLQPIELRVSDTGSGMDAETRTRIFEPFFTTKEFGKGVGLGLATVDGIVSQSGGSIVVESEPGEGSTFVIRLPAAEPADPTPVAAPPASVQGPVSPGATILVVEDDEFARATVPRMLELHGYEVRVVASGTEGLAVIEASAAELDLVLADIVMPGIRGDELAVRVSETHRDLPVVLMTGFADSAAIPDLNGRPIRCLTKPFTAAALAAAVAEELAAR